MTGFAAGIADAIGLPAVYVRAAFVVLTFAGGVGLLAYGIGVILTISHIETEPTVREISTSQKIGLALMFLAALVALETAQIWFGDAVVWPVALIAFGLAAMLDRSGEDFTTWLDPESDERPTFGRIVVGSAVLLSGVALFFFASNQFSALGTTLFAVLVTVLGLALLAGPFLWRLMTALSEERRDRIRSEERSEVAAHLHDSVLQTLALIQRADEPAKMVTLARAQERELRSWLFEQNPDVDAAQLSTVLQRAASRVERDYDVRIDVVTVGDMSVSGSIEAVVKAAGEAMINAARHAGVNHVSVYAEVSDESVDVYVTDQGLGFDLAAVGDDRHGLSDSIVARMKRHGGEAVIETEVGEGTEVHLSMPLASET